MSWWRLAERSRWRLTASVVDLQQSTRYWGALPRRHRWTVTPSLNWMRWGNIQPMDLGFKHMCQATVELVSSTDDVTMWIGLRNQRDEYTVRVSSTWNVVCLCLATFPHYCTDSDVTWVDGRGSPMHCWADLQSVHGFCCYGNSAEREMTASACTRFMPGLICSDEVGWAHRQSYFANKVQTRITYISSQLADMSLYENTHIGGKNVTKTKIMD